MTIINSFALIGGRGNFGPQKLDKHVGGVWERGLKYKSLGEGLILL